ncbi:MAG TPA: hypothetical protein DCM86_08950, partial [Verrucomicrobiales bacterium]|nr:hypothetical protein [Verrucomicrobiales bacterium]
ADLLPAPIASGASKFVANLNSGFQAGEQVRFFAADGTTQLEAHQIAAVTPDSSGRILVTIVGTLGQAYPAGRLVVTNDVRTLRLSRIYSSVDIGQNWVGMPVALSTDQIWIDRNKDKVKDPAEIYTQTYGMQPGGQGNLHFSIVADPSDSKILYIAGDRQPTADPALNSEGLSDWTGRVFRFTYTNNTRTAGSWTQIVGNHAGGTAPHADSRGMVFWTPTSLIEVDDGGIYRFNTTTSRWDSLNDNLNLDEFYSVAWYGDGSQLVAGAQDLGNLFQSASGSSVWGTLTKGDGAIVQTAVRPGANSDYILYEWPQMENLFIKVGTGLLSTVNVPTLRVAGTAVVGLSTMTFASFDPTRQFIQPFVVNATNPEAILVGTSFLYEYDAAAAGTTLGTTGRILFSLLGSAPPLAKVAGAPATDPAFSPPPADAVGAVNALIYGGFRPNAVPNGAPVANSFVIYAGTNGNAAGNSLWVRQSAGGPVSAVTSWRTQVGRPVKAIAVDPGDWHNVYVLDDKGRVWFSSHGGDGPTTNWQWQDLTKNTPLKVPGATDLSSIAVVMAGSTPVVLVGGQGGVFRKIGLGNNPWTEYGAGLPNARVTSIRVIPPAAAGAPGMIAVSTLGRGAWVIQDYTATIGVPSTVTVTGTDSDNEVFELQRDAGRPWLVNIYRYVVGQSRPATPAASIPFTSVSGITINGKGGDDQFIIDYTNGPLAFRGQIVIDGGVGSNRLAFRGPTAPSPYVPIFNTGLKPDPAAPADSTRGSEKLSARDAFGYVGSQSVLWANINTLATVTGSAPNWLDSIGLGLLLADETFQDQALLGLTGSGIAGLDSVGLLDALSGAQDQAGGGGFADPEGAVASEGDGGAGGTVLGSLLRRLLKEDGGLDLGDVGTTQLVDTVEALRQALDDLDSTPGNVTLDTSKDLDGDGTPDALFDVRFTKGLDGEINLDVDSPVFNGAGSVRLGGRMEVSADVAAHLVFGVDGSGFFLKPTADATFTLGNLSVNGVATGEGRLGFLGVEMKQATLAFDPQASISLNLVASAPGGLIRPSDLFGAGLLNVLTVGVNGHADATPDLELTGVFSVGLLLPDVNAPLALADATVTLDWADLSNPQGLTLSASAAGGGFLQFAQTAAQSALDGLKQFRDGLNALNTLLDGKVSLMPAQLNTLINIGQAFDERILKPLSGGGSTTASFDTVQDLAVQLAAWTGVDVNSVGLNFDPGTTALSYHLDFQYSFASQPQTLSLGLGQSAPLNLSASATVGATLGFSGNIGLNIGGLVGGGSLLNNFFVKDGKISAAVDLTATDLNASGNLGALAIQVAHGSVAAHPTFLFAIEHAGVPTPNTTVTLADLTAGFSQAAQLIASPVVGGTASLHLPFTATIGGGSVGSTSLTLDATIDFSQTPATYVIDLAGTITVSDFFQVSGSFGLTQTTQTVTLADGSSVQAQVLAIGGSQLKAFAGVNGPPTNAGAMGLSLDGVSFGLLLMGAKSPPAAATDLRTWTALKATATSVSLIGVEGITLDASDLTVEVNQAGGANNGTPNTSVVNFAGVSGGGLDVQTGAGAIKVDYAGSGGAFVRAETILKAQVYNYLVLQGAFAFERRSSRTITVTDGTTPESVPVEILTLGASNASAFVGVNGPAGQPGAIGLNLTGMDFALALMKRQAPAGTSATDLRSWVALKANVGTAALQGVTGLTASGTGLTLAINQGGGANNGVANATVADFATTPLTVSTGPATSINLDFAGAAGRLLRAHGTLNVAFGGFFNSTGTFDFEQSNMMIAGVSTRVTRLSASGASASLTAGPATLSASGVDGSFLFTPAGVAGKLTVADLSFSGIPGLSKGAVTSGLLEMNTTGVGVAVADGPVPFDDTAPDRLNFLRLGGTTNLSLALGGGASASLGGTFTFERSTQKVNGTDTTLMKIGVSGGQAAVSLGASAPTISASGITGAFLANGAGVAGKLAVANLTLSGIPGITRGAVTDAALEFNTTNAAAAATVDGVSFDHSAPDRLSFFAVTGHLELDVTTGPIVTQVVGGFGFERSTTTVNGVANTPVMKISVANAATSLTVGSGASGVQAAFSQINGAILVQGSGAAGSLSIGTAAITRADGVTRLPGLDFSASGLALLFNTTGAAVNASIGGTTLAFTSAPQFNFVAIKGTVSLTAANFITLTGSYGFERSGTGASAEIHIAAQGVGAALSVGGFSVGLNGGTLALLLKGDGTVALDAAGGLTLSGAGFLNATATSVRFQYNTTGTDFSAAPKSITVGDVNGGSLGMGAGTSAAPLLRLAVTGLQVTVAGSLGLKGDFEFAKTTTQSGTPIVKASVANLRVALGDGTTDYVVLQQGAGDFGALLITDAGVAGQITVGLTLQNIPSLQASGKFTLSFNTLPTSVNESFAIGTQTVSLSLPAGLYIHAEANPVDLKVLDTTLHGKIAFEQTTQPGGGRMVTISATGISITSLGATGTGALPAGLTNALSNASGILVLQNGQVAAALSFTATAGFGSFNAGATVKLLINTSSQAVNVTGTFGSINVGAGPLFAIETTLNLSFPGVEISGVFGFQNATEGANTVQVITGTNVHVFIGDPLPSTASSVGLELTNGQALFVEQNGQRAGFISGQVQLVGVPGFTLSATMTLRINQMTSAINRTVVVAGQQKRLVFGATEISPGTDGSGARIPFLQVAGTGITLSIANAVDFRGDITVTRDNGRFLVGAANAEVFLGKGPSRLPGGGTNPDAVGLLVSNIRLALVVFTSGAQAGKFAFDGQGSIGFLGLDGLDIALSDAAATFGLRLNRTGQAITTPITIPVVTAVNATTGENTYTNLSLSFPDASDIPQFSAGVRIHFDQNGLPVFELSGKVYVTQEAGGVADIRVTGLTPATGAALKIYSGSTSVFEISGNADFRVGGSEGFRLADFRINTVKFFDVALTLSGAGGQPLTADLASLGNGGVISRALLNPRRYLDITFNDVNGVGLDEASITDPGAEFKLLRGGADVTSELGTVTAVRLTGNTYRYSFTGSLTQDAEYAVEFQGGSWQDKAGTPRKPVTSTQSFVAYVPSGSFGAGSGLNPSQSGADGALPAPPTATLVNPGGGVAVNPVTLAAQRYIDVKFTSRTSVDIDPTTIDGDEITLLNAAGQTGLLDARLAPGAPIQVGKGTWRYFLVDANPGDNTPLFSGAEVVNANNGDIQNGTKTSSNLPAPAASEFTVSFNAGSFADKNGVKNLAKTEKVILDAAKAGSGSSSSTITLGPVQIEKPTIEIADLGFSNGKLIITVAIGATTASLNLGGSGNTGTQTASQGSSGFQLLLGGIEARFDIAVGLPGNFSVSTTGKFSVSVATLYAAYPNVFIAKANGITVQYDPAGDSKQELVRIDSASISFPKFGLTGSIAPTTTPGGVIPGLVVRQNGFTLGEATIVYGGAPKAGETAGTLGAGTGGVIGIEGILEFADIRAGVRDFEVNFDGGLSVHGSIFFATGGVNFLPGKAVSGKITDRDTSDDVNADGTQNTEALRVELDTAAFTGGAANFKFKADTLTVSFGGFLILSAKDFTIDTSTLDAWSNPSTPQATKDKLRLVQFGAVGAQVKAGPLQIGGEAQNFGFDPGGTFHPDDPNDPTKGFGVTLNFNSTDGGSLGWPSWLPVKINSVGIQWAHLLVDPSDFDLILSVSVTGLPSVGGLKFSGAIEGVHIRPKLLLEGKFPITQIDSFGVSVSGSLFGGDLDAALIGGILRVKGGKIMDSSDSSEPDDRIFFVGVEGGFKVAGLGLHIQFALSELGPLGVFISVSIPSGIIIVPQIGLAIGELSARVEFFKTLPSLDEPSQLRDFNVSSTPNAADWLASVKDQVLHQHLALQANPGQSGFAAAFTSPMLIKGSATLFDVYTSRAVFNGKVDLFISTDGKILIVGKLNFANDSISTSARLYADLSNIASGSAVVLFLADLPDQVRLLTLDGRLKMGFKDDTGADVSVPVVVSQPLSTDTSTSGGLTFPGNGEVVDAGRLNGATDGGSYYIDVFYTPGALQQLDYGSILDAGTPEISAVLHRTDGTTTTLTLDPTPVPLQTTVDPNGLSQVTPVTDTTQGNLQTLGIQRFRYHITNPGFHWGAGTVQVTFNGNTWGAAPNPADSASPRTTNTEFTQGFTIAGPVVSLLNPADGGRVKITDITSRMSVDVIFTPSQSAGAVLGLSPPTPTLSGVGLGTATLSGTPALVGRGKLVGDVDATASLLSSLDAGTLPAAVQGGFLGLNALHAGATLQQVTAGQVWKVVDGTTSYYVEHQQVSGADKLLLRRDDGSRTYRYTFAGAFKIGEVQLQFADNAMVESTGLGSVATSLRFTIDGSTADLVNPRNAGFVGLTVFGQAANYYLDVRFNPAAGTTISASSLTDAAAEIEVTLADGTALTVAGVPTQPGALAGTNTWRYALSGTPKAGLVTVRFLPGSFNDATGVTNLEQTETFTLVAPTGSFSNLVDGAVVVDGNLNNLDQGQAAGFFDKGATSPYIEVLLLPTTGASIPAGALPMLNLSGLGVVNSINLQGTLASVDPVDGSARVRYTPPTTFRAGAVTMTLGAWTDSAGNVAAARSAAITVRPSPKVFYIDLSGGITLDAGGLLPEPIFSVRGHVLFQADPTNGRFQLDFDGTFRVIYLGNLASVSGRFILQVPNSLTFNVPPLFTDADFADATLPGLVSKLTAHADPVSLSLWNQFSAGTRTTLSDAGSTLAAKRAAVVTGFNAIIGGTSLYNSTLFPDANLSPGAALMAHEGRTGAGLTIFNRVLLQETFKTEIRQVVDPDAVTPAELLHDLGVNVPSDSFLNGIQLPKLWGVMKLETNLEGLKNVGIDLKLAGVLQINTTRTDKVEKLTLKGIPGDEFAHYDPATDTERSS